MIGDRLMFGGRFVCPGYRLRLPAQHLRHLPTPLSNDWLRRSSGLRIPSKSQTQDKGSCADDSLVNLGSLDSIPSSSDNKPAYGDGSKASKPSRQRRDGRGHHPRGRRLFMRREDLGVGILGEPASAIVLIEGASKGTRNRGRPEVPPVSNSTDESATAEGSPLVLEAVEAQDHVGDATPAEVQANIDSLRPDGVTLAPQREFDSIAHILHEGFTVAQLLGYVEDHQNNQKKHAVPAKLGGDDCNPWIIERFPWAPNGPDASQHQSPALNGYVSKTMSAKEVLVVRLMRECWGVSVQELMDGPGRINVRVRDPEFALLLVGEKLWLRTISRVYLKGVGGRLELRRSGGLLGIVAPKATAETVLNEINEVLRRTVTQSFDLNLITTEPVRKELLDQVGRLTNSHIRLDQANGARSVSVSWVETPGNRSPDWERTVDMVFRHLLMACGHNSHRPLPSSLTVVPDLKEGRKCETGRLVVEQGARQKLAWNDRLNPWARWVRPQSQSHEDSTTSPSSSPSLSPSTILKWPFEAGERELHAPTRPFAELPSAERLWPPIETATTAVFGHILHPLNRPSGTNPTASLVAAPLNPSLNRILSPVAPAILGDHLLTDVNSTVHTSASLLIRLVPSPRDPAAAGAPALELRPRPSRINSVWLVESLTAIHDTHTADILFPDLPVDVRVTQVRSSKLAGIQASRHPSMSPLVDFLSKARLSPADGHLDTPSVIKALSLPSRLFLSRGSSQSLRSSGSECGVIKVDYLFAGLEVRRYITNALGGWTLVYTSTEVGQGNANEYRSEVSLQAKLVAGPAENSGPFSASSESATLQFFRDVVAIAEGHRIAWTV